MNTICLKFPWVESASRLGWNAMLVGE